MDDLKRRILDFIRENPGSSTAAVRRAVSAKHSRVSEALSELEESGRARNSGNRNRHRWELADELVPGLGTTPGELPDAFPEEIAGVRVAAWIPPQEAAACLGTTTRTLSRWENRGLPAAREGQDVRYPFPHAVVWAVWYGVEKQKDGPTELSIELALSKERTDQLEKYGEHGLPEV